MKLIHGVYKYSVANYYESITKTLKHMKVVPFRKTLQMLPFGFHGVMVSAFGSESSYPKFRSWCDLKMSVTNVYLFIFSVNFSSLFSVSLTPSRQPDSVCQDLWEDRVEARAEGAVEAGDEHHGENDCPAAAHRSNGECASNCGHAQEATTKEYIKTAV